MRLRASRGRVGVHGRQRSVVAGVHGLQHVEGRRVADLADDDAVGPHAQGVADQVADRDLSLALDVRGPRLQAQDVGWLSWSSAASSIVMMRSSSGMKEDMTLSVVVLPEPVPPLIRMFSRPRTQASRTSAAAPRQGSHGDQILDGERVLGELADGQRAAVEGDGRQHRVDAAAVGQAGVDHGAGLIDAPADTGDDAVDGPTQVLLVREPQVGLVQAATALDEDRVRAVDHDLGDLRVAQQRLQRTVAEDVVDDLLRDPRAVTGRQRLLRLGQDRLDRVEDVLLEQPLLHLARVRLLPEGLHEVVVHLVLEGGELVLLEPDARESHARWPRRSAAVPPG